ncbi:MAG TPA: hypothetical protein VMT99_01900 [Candidatus Paceibacterota bacterium]|nr:hypothetical protein [Candidatus Paceibacterota bacterium]
MSGFVNSENTGERPDGGAYGEVIRAISKDGVCPFCPENLVRYHKNPILREGAFWLLTDNMYPYEGAKHHALLIHKRHIGDLRELEPGAWDELHRFVADLADERHIPGGTLIMRFGDTRYTGASVSHLHANVVSSSGDDGRKPILARVG